MERLPFFLPSSSDNWAVFWATEGPAPPAPLELFAGKRTCASCFG
jgi:hypothetical protein